ncbi:MAG: sulfite exporter TauE/SafE family protein [Gemmatimonadota bacterium]
MTAPLLDPGHLHPLSVFLIFSAAAIGGTINAIAGGGTLVTFPAIVALGVPPLMANATSTVALWPGAVSSMWGYRGELAGARNWIVRFTLPSLLGGGLGAWLLLHTSDRSFAEIVPFLVLGATVLFLVQAPLMRWMRGRSLERAIAPEGVPPAPPWRFLVAQFAVGIYGGYFGAGVGILMLAVLGFMGLTNIHTMNGLKNWGGLCMNAVAALLFVASGIVNWPVALAMAAGGLLGGYMGSRLAQRVGQQPVRRAITVIGFASFVYLLAR